MATPAKKRTGTKAADGGRKRPDARARAARESASDLEVFRAVSQSSRRATAKELDALIRPV